MVRNIKRGPIFLVAATPENFWELGTNACTVPTTYLSRTVILALTVDHICLLNEQYGFKMSLMRHYHSGEIFLVEEYLCSLMLVNFDSS